MPLLVIAIGSITLLDPSGRKMHGVACSAAQVRSEEPLIVF